MTWLVPQKITLPAVPEGTMPREALLEPRVPVRVLVGGPGDGKSLALLAQARAAVASGGMVLWYALDPDDADPAVFFAYMVAAMRERIPDFGSDVLPGAGAPVPEARVLWQRFFSAVAAYNLPGLAILLDDLHELEGGGEPEVIKSLVALFDRLPPGVTIGMSTRRRPALALARHQAAGRVAVLGPERLRFTPVEVTAYLESRATDVAATSGVRIATILEAWRGPAATLEGWPLGLDLLTRSASATSGPVDVRLLAEYVSEELIAAQPPARRLFMAQVAILQAPTAADVTAIYELPDALARLESLADDHLIERLTGDGGYRYAGYMVDGLRAITGREVPESTLASWHRRAATHFADHGAYERALPHLLARQHWPGAIAAAVRAFPVMWASGRHGHVARAIGAFPAGPRESEPWLVLWRGIEHARTGAHVDAAAAYERARALFGEREDSAGELKAMVRLAGMALLAEDMKTFQRHWLQAQALLAGGQAEDRADLLLMRALAAERRGDVALTRECNEAVLDIATRGPADVEVATCRAIAALNLFSAAWNGGDLAGATTAVAAAAAIAREWGFYGMGLYTDILTAQIDLATGDLAGAGTRLRTLPPDWADRLDWHDAACAQAVLGQYMAYTGAFREAEEALRRSTAIFAAAGFDEGQKIPRERLMGLALLRGQPTRALAIADEGGFGEIGNVYDAAIGLTRARALHLAGRVADARAAWTEVLPALEDRGAALMTARALLYATATEVVADDMPAATAFWARATAAIEAGDFGFLRGQDPALWAELAPFVEPTTAPAPEPVAAPATGPLAPEPMPVRPATGPLTKHGDGPSDRLVINVFGTFEVRQGGVLLDHWPRRKARLMLAALALYPRGLPAAELAEAIGEDVASPAFVSTIRTNVMTLRQLFEPAPKAGTGSLAAPAKSGTRRGDSRYLRFENDRYMLATEAVERLDWHDFDGCMATGDAARTTRPDEALIAYERAMALYRGNLLEEPALVGRFEAERESFRRRAMAALTYMADAYTDRGDVTGEGVVLARAVGLAPCEEDLYVRLMRHHKHAGRPERVRQAYWDCRKALKHHLGVAPSADFEASYREVAGPSS